MVPVVVPSEAGADLGAGRSLSSGSAAAQRTTGVSSGEPTTAQALTTVYQLTSFQISGSRVASSAPTSAKIATARFRWAIASSSRPAA